MSFASATQRLRRNACIKRSIAWPSLLVMMAVASAYAATPLVDVLNREVPGGGFGHAMAAHGDELVIANDFAVNGVVRKGFVYRRINGQQGSHSITLGGVGIEPQLAISPAAVSLGAMPPIHPRV